jgi:hypothetical protein
MTIIVICYVAVDGIAFVATFYKSYFSLILSQLFLRLRVSFLSTLPKRTLHEHLLFKGGFAVRVWL